MLRWYETRLATDPFSNRAAVSQDLDTVAIWTHFSFPTREPEGLGWALARDRQTRESAKEGQHLI